MKMLILKRIGPPTIALILFVLGWELAVRLLSFSPLILPGPYVVLCVLWGRMGYLVTHAGITLGESVSGFLLGGTVAILLAVIFQFSDRLERALYPYVIAFKAIPLVALAPLVTVWCGTGIFSKVVLASVISFFPVLVNAVVGMQSLAIESLDLMTTWSASQWQVLIKLRIPNALPSIFAGMKISATFAVIGSVVAEFVGSQSGIGYVIKSSSYYLDTDLTFAAIIVSALIGLLFFGAVVLLERMVVFWHPKAQAGTSEQGNTLGGLL